MGRHKEYNGFYKTNRHACYDLEYHLVVVTGYRYPVLTEEIEERLVEITKRIFEENYGCEVSAVNCDKDHVHILFSAPPQVTLTKLIYSYKTVTSRLLRKEFNEQLKKYYWNDDHLWSKSYFIGSVSERTHEAVKTYIADQKSAAHLERRKKKKKA